jgi:hypothetical protein
MATGLSGNERSDETTRVVPEANAAPKRAGRAAKRPDPETVVATASEASVPAEPARPTAPDPDDDFEVPSFIRRARRHSHAGKQTADTQAERPDPVTSGTR